MIEFLDLAADFACVEKQARARIEDVLASQVFVLGAQTRELEHSLRALAGARFAVACSSGSDALYLALLALGIGPGDAVLVPAFTFFASAGAVVRAGAHPVFCDIDECSFTAGVEQLAAAVAREFDASLHHRRSGARLRAVVPVHLYGRVAPMPDIVAWAQQSGLAIVEDAAQAIGARMAGTMAGTFGEVGCLSFYPTKNLGGAGDGGMLLTGSEELAARLTRLRVHGADGSYEHVEAGINARMNELVAAVLNAKLERLAGWNERRRRIAELYAQGLHEPAASGALVLPAPGLPGEHVWHQFAVRIASGRDTVRCRLDRDGIATRVFYPLPLHRQPCFAGYGYAAGDLPASEAAASQVLCLPMHPSLSDADVTLVCERVAAACAAVSS
ncbi:MAG TPA: DegT/DnrJ/EryC1/StrS family aminotransferase [Candidatus Binatia bacterium]|nr:DegT/DnrJ/EryC1/StrS family aminotransferase [Candidatus Binatia bacterium]